MLLRLRADLSSLRAWHLELVRRLQSRPGLVVEIEHHGAAPLAPHAERLLRFEALVHGTASGTLARPAPHALAASPTTTQQPDLVLDLTGTAAGSPVPTWRLVFDGEPGDRALFATLSAGGSPVAELRGGEQVVASGRLGTEAPGNVLASLHDAFARTITLILAALDGAVVARPMPALAADIASRSFGGFDLGAAVVRRLAAAAARRAHKLRYHEPQWRVGWRHLDGPDLIDLRHHPEGGWIDLPDDGKRFYADPFPIEHSGQVHLFVEEYPHQTGKGIISAVPFGPKGPLDVPVPVLELPYHLSYPFVFGRKGEVWMVPESCAAGSIDLFRATRFPGGWVKEATLVADVTASDATLFEHGELWWLFATVRGGGSYSDSLHLWFAENFKGPWTPHPKNPVLIDNASARPAGRMTVREGEIWRPVQDCRIEYGAALGLARVTRLDREGFDQTVEAFLTAGPRWPGRLIHTVNRAGPFEFIDGSGLAKKML